MTCVRLAVKYKMDHVIVELVEKWEIEFREKNRSGRAWNLCSFHIEKEPESLKHFSPWCKTYKKSYSQNSNTGGTHVKWNTCSTVKFLLSDTDRNLHLWLPRPSSTVTWGIVSACLSHLDQKFNPNSKRKNAAIKTPPENYFSLMNLVFWNYKDRIIFDITCAVTHAAFFLSLLFSSKVLLTLHKNCS